MILRPRLPCCFAFGLLLGCGSLSPPATADSAWALSMDAGSTGVGAGVTAALAPAWNVRAAWRGWSADGDLAAANNNGVQGDEARYSADLQLRGGHLLLDYYPGAGSFYLSAGAMANRSRLQVDALCPPERSSGCEVGDSGTARLAAGDTLHTTVALREFVPYAGLGFGNALGTNTGLAWQLDLGVLLLGKPDLTLTYDGSCNGTVAAAECQRQIKQEEQELEKEYEDYRFYPVLNLSLAYRIR